MTDEEKKLARLYVLLEPELKDKLEEIAFRRKRQTGKRVTLTDLVTESLERLVREDAASQQGQQYGGRQSQGEHDQG